MKKLIKLFTLVLLVPVTIQAQDLADALRYSSVQVQGTARAGGMGNAFGALGGDFTSVSINPAGLGVYRAGELTLTPAFGQVSVESNYLGNSMNDNVYNFSFNNLSYVAAIETRNTSESGLVNFNIGIGYNRLKDFNSVPLAGANNSNSSFLDYTADAAFFYGFDPDGNNDYQSEFYEQLAWDTYLLWPEELSNNDHHLEPNDDLNYQGYGQSQRKSISRQGSVDEYSLAFGLNFNHKLYLGASLGITDIYYKQTSRLLEEDVNNSIPYFNEMEFDSYLRTTGTGYNGKIGIIYKPTQQIRLGASVHTPTFYNLHDIFETSMSSSITYDNGVTENYDATSPQGEYDYDLETPMRATLSGAFVIAKAGLISVDYEYVDYGSASLRRGVDGADFVEENGDIAEAYRSVGNLRIGGELKVTNAVSLRAGFENYPSAYNAEAFDVSQPNSDAGLNVYSAGLGYRNAGFFFDVAYRYSIQQNHDLLYPEPITDYYSAPEMAQFDTIKNKVLFTLGFKF